MMTISAMPSHAAVEGFLQLLSLLEDPAAAKGLLVQISDASKELSAQQDALATVQAKLDDASAALDRDVAAFNEQRDMLAVAKTQLENERAAFGKMENTFLDGRAAKTQELADSAAALKKEAADFRAEAQTSRGELADREAAVTLREAQIGAKESEAAAALEEAATLKADLQKRQDALRALVAA